MGFVVLADSSCDLPRDLCKQEDIVIVPMPVSIEGKTYQEGIDIFPEDFYPRFPSFKELPKTSQPNLGVLQETYEELLAKGNEVIAIHLSSGLSATYNTAMLARDMCSQPDKVHVIDSLGASLGYGLLVLGAREIIRKESSWEEIEKQILQLRSRLRYIFTPDTLEYLVKGGRVSKTSILHLTSDGRIEALTKVRFRKASLRKLADLLKEEIRNPEDQVIGISHAACLADAKFLAEEIKQRVKVKDILISDIGCIIGSHTGPGTIALFYQR
jgi:DegV family protein with EDD domain